MSRRTSPPTCPSSRSDARATCTPSSLRTTTRPRSSSSPFLLVRIPLLDSCGRIYWHGANAIYRLADQGGRQEEQERQAHRISSEMGLKRFWCLWRGEDSQAGHENCIAWQGLKIMKHEHDAQFGLDRRLRIPWNRGSWTELACSQCSSEIKTFQYT